MTDLHIEVISYVGILLSVSLGAVGVWAARRNYKMDMVRIKKACEYDEL